MRKPLITLVAICAFLQSEAQDIQRKQLAATRITGNIHIDGNLNEPEWQNAQEATDFIQEISKYKIALN